MKQLIIYVHGKCGNASESEHYRPLFSESDVIGFDYKSENPWDAKDEFSKFFDLNTVGYDSVIVVANSIGAFYVMNSLNNKKISKALFISPIINMEKLIMDMMNASNITEEELKNKRTIFTSSGEVLSWEYLLYVRSHPISWSIPTCILYGEKDNLTSIDTIFDFSSKIDANLTIIEEGEHWFHTDEQIKILDRWVQDSTK